MGDDYDYGAFRVVREFRVPQPFFPISERIKKKETSFPSPLFLPCLHAHAPKNAPPNAEALYFTGIEPRRS